jgi:hypothetical protein
MFERPHHQAIARVLAALNGPLLRAHRCLFGGGTAIVLRFGEYRESLDLDFLVSDVASYRDLRQLLTSSAGLAAILTAGHAPITQRRELRADQYGIRTLLALDGRDIKFEIILEARIDLDPPTDDDAVCGIATLSLVDLAASKLLANSDRWGDDGVFNRDVIDLAMMQPRLPLLRQAIGKAESAYGRAILADLEKALDRFQQRAGWLDRCMQALAMNVPKAILWQRLRALRRVLPKGGGGLAS